MDQLKAFHQDLGALLKRYAALKGAKDFINPAVLSIPDFKAAFPHIPAASSDLLLETLQQYSEFCTKYQVKVFSKLASKKPAADDSSVEWNGGDDEEEEDDVELPPATAAAASTSRARKRSRK